MAVICSRPGKFDAVSMYKCVYSHAVVSDLTLESLVTRMLLACDQNQSWCWQEEVLFTA